MALAIANRKKMKNTFSANQMMPGTQVNGAKDRRQPAAEKQDCRHRAHGRDRDVFAEHEQQIGRRRIFDHEAGDEFGLCFDEIERRTVRFRHCGNDEDHEHREQRQPVPGRAGRSRAVLRRHAERFSEPTHNSTVIITKPIETS